MRNGAGEEIRTLDPNLGNCPLAISLSLSSLAKPSIIYAKSIAYFPARIIVGTLQFPAASLLLLPPCFPAHAAPAWGSKHQARDPPDSRRNLERNGSSDHGKMTWQD